MESVSQIGTDLVIVSAFGRGNWLATELADRGWSVTLVDVSERLGPWDPEDAEGPFGLLETSDLLPSQKTILQGGGGLKQSSSGLTIWLKSGPLDGRSELTPLHLEKKNIPPEVVAYLRHPGLPTRESEKERKNLLKLSFSNAWLAHFAHQLASPVIAENHVALQTGFALPLFAPFSVRQLSKGDALEGLKNCQKSGVKIRAHSNIKDVRLVGRNIDAIEVDDERAGIERGRSFVWMLSSAETRCMSETVYATLYPDGLIEPDWFWARYRLELRGRAFMDQLPLSAVLIEDPYLPWTNENVLVMRQPAREKDGPKTIDVWLRLPIWSRNEKSYLQDMAGKIEAVISRRMPLAEPVTVLLPAEARYSRVQLGPARVGVYRRETLASLKILRSPNFLFCGPEQHETLDWLGVFRAQNAVLQKLEKLKIQWLAVDAKIAAKQNKQQRKNSSHDPKNDGPPRNPAP